MENKNSTIVAVLLLVIIISFGYTFKSLNLFSSKQVAQVINAGHPNEPAGSVQLSPTLTGDIQPPLQNEYVPGSANDIGWIRVNTADVVTDPTSPEGSTNVLETRFPSGMIGGGSPGVVSTYQLPNNPGNWPQHPTRVYYSYWYKFSPNFPINLVSNKITYIFTGSDQILFQAEASADYKLVNGVPAFLPGQATQYDAMIYPEMFLSGIVSHNGIPGTAVIKPNGDPLGWPLINRGVWQHYEFLFIANTPGAEDGTVQVWLDGRLVISIDRIKFTDAGSPFTWGAWWPVYGGGGSVPNDGVGGYHRIKDFYVSGTNDAGSPVTPPVTPPPTTPPPPGNQLPRAQFDGLKSDGVTLNGWSYDPDTSSQSTVVDIYADGPKGSGGTLLGTGTVVSRPDVNTAFGITGTHGFEFVIPSNLRDNRSHSYYIYAEDTSNASLVTQAGNSPQSYTLAGAPPPPPSAPTVSISASPSSITSGQSSLLTWSTTNASSCTASGGWSGTQTVSGTKSVTPTTSTTYTLSCTGSGGTANQSTTVNVTALPPPPTNTLPVVTFDGIQSDGLTLYGWSYDPDTSSQSTTVNIYVGGPIGQGSLLGTATVVSRPDVNTAFGITGNHGFTFVIPTNLRDGVSRSYYPYAVDTSNSSLTILAGGAPKNFTVSPPVSNPTPIISLSALPLSITSGQSSTLTWSSSNATSCTASGGWTGSQTTAGTKVVTPTLTTTTYTLTCTGAGGTASPQSVTVTVGAPTGDTQPPSTPTNLQGSALDQSRTSITWSPSTDNIGVTGYKVYKNGIALTQLGATSYIDSGLTSGVTYTYAVSAFDLAGNESPLSPSIQVTAGTGPQTPPPPTNNKFSIGDWVVVTTSRLNIRSTPGGTKTGTQNQGATGQVTAGPVSQGGYTWWDINFGATSGFAAQGWSTEDYLAKASAPTPLSIGKTVSITENLKVRAQATTNSSQLGVQHTGATGTIVGGPSTANGYTWWKVDFYSGADGWVVDSLR